MVYGLIVNPISGNTDKTDWIELFKASFGAPQHKVLIHHTTPFDKAKIQPPFAQRPDVIVAAGGDGTMNYAAYWALNWNVPLGILPLGSGNGMAAELQLGSDIEVILDKIALGNIVLVDVLYINQNLCLHIADFGFNARIVQGFAEGTFRGNSGYAINLLKLYSEYKATRFLIQTLEGVEMEVEAFILAIANGSRYGSQVLINPLGKVYDGVFEISILKNVEGIEGIEVLFNLLDQELDDLHHLQNIRSKGAKIHNLGLAPFQIDGEPQTTTPMVEIAIKPQALQVIV